MSKRGRRRNSKRRKSSSSSKQSVSPYIFQKLNKNNVSYKDDIVEKGEADSLRKENVLSGSEDEEKYDNAPPKEKRFKQDYPINSSPHQKTDYSKTTEDEEMGVKIMTSVSLSNVEDSSPRIMFQQCHEPVSENPLDPSRPVTNILKINCSGPNVRLEIRETLQLNASGLKTTFVLRNDGNAEMFFTSECERTWAPNNEAPMRQMHNVNSHVFESPSSPPLAFNIRPLEKRKNLCNEQFWKIPPPQEFADLKYASLDELSHDLASCRIEPTDPDPPLLVPEVFSVPPEERVDRARSLDQLSEWDNYEPSFMRPSFSTNRSSFTKDFISCQKRRSWIRNNSIATVQRRKCSVPMKRRQTFPGASDTSGMMQEEFMTPYAESFSSLFMCSLPYQTERLGRYQQPGDRLSAFGAGNFPSLNTKRDSHSGKQALLSPFYMTSSEENPDEVFPVYDVCGRRSSSRQARDFTQSIGKDAAGCPETEDCEYRVIPRELADSGFDQEMGEVEYVSPEALSQRSLAIQITPPSCSGSEEHMLQSPNVLLADQHANPVPAEHRKSSVVTVTAGNREQISLHRGSTSSSSHRRVSVKEPAMPALQDLQIASTDDVSVETEPVRDVPESAVVVEEQGAAEDPDRAEEGQDRPEADPGGPSEHLDGAEAAQSSTDTTVCVREPRSRADKQITFRSPTESKEHLRPVAHKEADGSSSDHWAKRRKLFKESKQWSSAGGSSMTSEITEESVSEETRSMDVTVIDEGDRGFYTDTFHSSTWIYQGDDVVPEAIRPSLATRTRSVSIRDRTVKISKGSGEYPWGFRIQFSKPIVVTEVDTNGAAEEAGLMVGDYVLAVNGIDVTSIPHSEAADLARQGPDILTLTIGSDIARSPNTPRPACRGYLHKRTQSGLIKGWRKRWFVLRHDCCLYYYRHKRDEGKRRALSVVKLEGAEVGADTSLGKPFVFRCRPTSGQRVFFFCATSNQEMKRWLEAMQKSIHPITQNHVWVDVTRHNSNLPPLAVKSPDCLGLLHKMDKSRDTWLQHYCILKDACLYMYSGIRATHAHGGIYLQGYLVREQPYGSKKSTIELKPPSDEFKTFHLCAENPTENKRWISAIKASIKKWLPLHQALQDYMSRPPEETRM
ncbi:unnamed protein product [Ophioblennius macclurei]